MRPKVHSKMLSWNSRDFYKWINDGCPFFEYDDGEYIMQLCLENENGIHESIAKLSNNLSILALRNNNILHIPDFLLTLTNLKELNLSFNDITTIPDSISNLKSLEFLSLANNEITEIPESFVNLKFLLGLHLQNNRLTTFPYSIISLTKLKVLILSANEIREIPDSISQLINLGLLGLSHAYIKNIPDSVTNLTKLHCLDLSHNTITYIPDSIVNLINLNTLMLCSNQISHIPDSISRLSKLRFLHLPENKITTIPYSIINLRNLDTLSYFDNPIEYVHPRVIQFLKRHRNIYSSAYKDSQSVHKTSIQEGVRKSIQNILSIQHNTEEDIFPIIKQDAILDENAKECLISYSQDLTTHSVLMVNFLDVLRAVWNRIRTSDYSHEIKKVLNMEMMDSKEKCFTGRISRLVNCLNGFDDLVKIHISDNERIGTIISLVKNQLEKDGRYDIENHISISRSKLLALDYDEDVIRDWINQI